jgi:hypothetical protein
MFGLFKKKKEIKNPWEDKRWFINDIIDAIYKIGDPNAKLEAYISLHDMTTFWEAKFDIECVEMSLALDDISDAFLAADDIDVIYNCALSFGMLSPHARRRLTHFYECDLAPHFKLRLFKLFIDLCLRQEFAYIDQREIEPRYQHAFYEIENFDPASFSDAEKRIILERKFGIADWKSQNELMIENGVIIDYKTP